MTVRACLRAVRAPRRHRGHKKIAGNLAMLHNNPQSELLNLPDDEIRELVIAEQQDIHSEVA